MGISQYSQPPSNDEPYMCLRLGGRPLSPSEGTSMEIPWEGTCLTPASSSLDGSFCSVGGMLRLEMSIKLSVFKYAYD